MRGGSDTENASYIAAVEKAYVSAHYSGDPVTCVQALDHEEQVLMAKFVLAGWRFELWMFAPSCDRWVACGPDGHQYWAPTLFQAIRIVEVYGAS